MNQQISRRRWQILSRCRHALTRCLEVVVMLSVAVMVLDVLWGVLSRFVLRDPSRWTEEVATMLLIWVTLLGAALALAREEHLGVDYLVKKLDPAAQRCMRLFVDVIVMAFAIVVMILGGWTLTRETFLVNQVSPALGIKIGYVYSVVPLSGALMTLFSMDRFARTALFSDLSPGQNAPTTDDATAQMLER
ncbi:MAG: TRAP transporter small permease [Planctomycetota bacterium]